MNEALRRRLSARPAPTETRRGALGVALGGGTARAFAHVGVLKTLERAGQAPSCVAGTSAGAFIAAAYALGANGDALDNWARQLNTIELWSLGLDFGLHRASLVNGERIARWLDRKVFFGASFADTMIPLAISCTDLSTGELTILREGSIARAVQASCALPGLLAPVDLGGRVLVDGGFVEAVPYRALATLSPRTVLGVRTGIDADHALIVKLARGLNRSAVGRHWRSLAGVMSADTAVGRLVKGLAEAVRSYDREQTIPIGALELRAEPPIAWWDFHRSPLAIVAGERAAQQLLEQRPDLLVDLAPAPHRRGLEA